ncbi:MAG: hypothetical protein AB7E80_13600 [Hyphomicrobiaceae bacterium]
MTLEIPRRSAAAAQPGRRAKAGPLALPRRVSRQIARFDRPVRAEIRKIVRNNPRAGDLVSVFPALLYALATEHGTLAQRERTLALVEAGAQLKSVARALSVPMWLRRLPPEAFHRPLDGLPVNETAGRRLTERLPARGGDCANWLDSIRFATAAGGLEFAHWISRQRASCYAPVAQDRLAVLAAYVWFSCHPETEAGALVWGRWRPEAALDTAICSAKSWFNRVLLSVRLLPGVIDDTWLDDGQAGKYTFVPLITSQALLAEARAMNNCCDQYAAAISGDRSRLFAVRENGVSIATLEIGAHPRERGAVTLAQLKGQHNVAASIEVWQAAYQWLAGQKRLLHRRSQFVLQPRPFDTPTWVRLMSPYREATGGAPWLPETADYRAIETLDRGLHSLAADSEVRSWLFA